MSMGHLWRRWFMPVTKIKTVSRSGSLLTAVCKSSSVLVDRPLTHLEQAADPHKCVVLHGARWVLSHRADPWPRRRGSLDRAERESGSRAEIRRSSFFWAATDVAVRAQSGLTSVGTAESRSVALSPRTRRPIRRSPWGRRHSMAQRAVRRVGLHARR